MCASVFEGTSLWLGWETKSTTTMLGCVPLFDRVPAPFGMAVFFQGTLGLLVNGKGLQHWLGGSP